MGGLTGRSRTLTASATVMMQGEYVLKFNASDEQNFAGTNNSFGVATLGCDVGCDIGFDFSSETEVSLNLTIGGLAEYYPEDLVVTLETWPYSFGEDFSQRYNVSIDISLSLDMIEGFIEDTIETGQGLISRISFSESAAAGAAVAVQVVYNGNVITGTSTFDSTLNPLYAHEVSLASDVNCLIEDPSISLGNAQASTSYSLTDWTNNGYTAFGDRSYECYDLDGNIYGTLSFNEFAGSAVVTAWDDVYAITGGASSVTLDSSVTPPSQYDLLGRLINLSGELSNVSPISINVYNDGIIPVGKYSSDDSFTHSESAWSFDATISIPELLRGTVVNDGSSFSNISSFGVYQSLDPDSLEAAGEDSTDTLLFPVGYQWSALNIGRDPSLTLDDCRSTSNWAPIGSTTITPVGDIGLEFSSTSGCSATLTVPSDSTNWTAFRYLEIVGTITSVAVNVTITLNGQSWTGQFNSGSSSSIILDLCCASTDTNSLGGEAYGGTPYLLGWGVDSCSSLVISFDNNPVVLTGVFLVTAGEEMAFSRLPTDPFFFLQTDGRVSGPSYEGGAISITDFAEILGNTPSFVANALPGPGDGVHGPASGATFLGAGGSTYDWSSNSWTDWIDITLPDSGSPLPIPAQDFWGMVLAYPGIGNPWNGSSYPSWTTIPKIPLYATKLLRGQGWGLIFNTLGSPNAGVAVSAIQAAGPTVGTGVSQGNGAYRTGTPYGPGDEMTQSVVNSSAINLGQSSTWTNGVRSRVSFKTPPIVPSDPILTDPIGTTSSGSGSSPSCSISSSTSYLSAQNGATASIASSGNQLASTLLPSGGGVQGEGV